jgi:hypothetical protein
MAPDLSGDYRLRCKNDRYDLKIKTLHEHTFRFFLLPCLIFVRHFPGSDLRSLHKSHSGINVYDIRLLKIKMASSNIAVDIKILNIVWYFHHRDVEKIAQYLDQWIGGLYREGQFS